MKHLLLIFGIALIAASVALAGFVDAKSAAVSGGGFNVPYWPFVGAVGLILILIWVVVMPFGRDLVKMYFRTKVAIVKAENHVPDDSPAKEPINPIPKPPDAPPTDVAKQG